MSRRVTRWLGIVALSWLCGCTADTDTTAPAPVAAPAACDDEVPLVTWETFGEGFLSTYCQGCHASTAEDRQGAPDYLVFDTEEETLRYKQIILLSASSEEPIMPPNGGPVDDDRELLGIWLGCFAE